MIKKIEQKFDRRRMESVAEKEIVSNLESIGFKVKRSLSDGDNDFELQAEKNYTKILIKVLAVVNSLPVKDFSEEDKNFIRQKSFLSGAVPYLAKVTLNDEYQKIRVDYYEIR